MPDTQEEVPNKDVRDEKMNELQFVGEVGSAAVKARQAEVFGLGTRGHREPLKALEQKSDLVDEVF